MSVTATRVWTVGHAWTKSTVLSALVLQDLPGICVRQVRNSCGPYTTVNVRCWCFRQSVVIFLARALGEGGGYSISLQIFTRMIPLSYTWSKISPLSYIRRISQNNRLFCNRHVFPRFSVVLIQLRSHFCQNVAPFDILRLSRHFFHFAADLWPFRILKWQ